MCEIGHIAEKAMIIHSKNGIIHRLIHRKAQKSLGKYTFSEMVLTKKGGTTIIGNMESINGFIKKHRWVYAKTMPQAPHEYVCKDYIPKSEHEAFERFVIYIRENGTPAYYGRRKLIYWLNDGYYYWTMGSPNEGVGKA